MNPDPAAGFRADLEAGVDPVVALERFRAAQARFHESYARDEGVTCRAGCSACCSQMVFDVSAVEVEALGRFLRRTGRAAEVLPRLERRRAAYDRLRVELPRRAGEGDDDWTERVALAFWARGIECAFLDVDGACTVHELRPQSCRRFFVTGPSELCAPASADDPARGARMVEPGSEDEVDALQAQAGRRVPFDPEDDRLDHALARWLRHRRDV